MQSKALTNINSHKLNFKYVNSAKENSVFFQKFERQRDKLSKHTQNFNIEC